MYQLYASLSQTSVNSFFLACNNQLQYKDYVEHVLTFFKILLPDIRIKVRKWRPWDLKDLFEVVI